MDSRNKNKSSILITLFFVAMCAFALACIFITKRIPIKYIAVLTVALLYLYVVPDFDKKYKQLFEDYDNDPKVYIPFFNEIYPLDNITGLGSLISLIATLVFFGLSMLNPEFYANIVSQETALAIPTLMQKAWFTTFVLMNAFEGVGYIGVFRAVFDLHTKAFDSRSLGDNVLLRFLGFLFRYFPGLMYMFLFLPIIRILCLLFLADKMEALLSCEISFYNVDDEVEDF